MGRAGDSVADALLSTVLYAQLRVFGDLVLSRVPVTPFSPVDRGGGQSVAVPADLRDLIAVFQVDPMFD
jgi:hypothetical protein